MAKVDRVCGKCASFLSKQGVCLNCHPTGRARDPGNQKHGNSRTQKAKKRGK